MKLSYHGQSVVYFESNGKKGIIDPFITGNALSDLDVETLELDYIILTHCHEDHFGDTIELAQRTQATVVGTAELANYLSTAKGIDNVHPMNIGGQWTFDFGKLKFVQAFHSSSLMNDEGIPIYLGMPMGVILELEGTTVYHTGDTALFSDMKLIADRHPVDVCFIPIGDNFTMGIEDASYAINTFIQPKVTVPIHFNTFPLIEQDPEAFKAAVHAGEVQVLQPGEAVQI
ncbi:metal-dependent hydrolase [Staphylococcus sp. 17KM0847]|uniref:metal-dependent hydrolase n=1 Tax=Staphylococcus sp. 17KM0847 TaxID=2583989 RepID=UPI0015DBE114|nr:metal-dependent hydrolase [Staphylococcus sp. 17KM0847]QLK85932.1 metal-dependent hydrolase [Staphylococcus sp. 17KM0847]